MTHVQIPSPRDRYDGPVTPHALWHTRRALLKDMGFLGLSALMGLATGCSRTPEDSGGVNSQTHRKLVPGEDPSAVPPDGVFPAPLHPDYRDAGRPLTPEAIAGRYNNFYEFTQQKDQVWQLVENMKTRPWSVEVGGLVQRPKTYDIDDILTRFAMEDRVYRFRCVEAWAMTVPWTGFPLLHLIQEVAPLSSATHVRFVSLLDRQACPGQRSDHWDPAGWPYCEGLTMAEATHPLTLLATGIYGHQLPRQHGAPIRLIAPWKYGFKSIKSLVRIEFVNDRPGTFWNDFAPHEYSFHANVDPKVPHPRWSQATERLIEDGRRVPTLPYNGYGKQVAHLYE